MRNLRAFAILVFLFTVVCSSVIAVYAGDTSLNPEDLVAKNLDAIGSAQARAAAKSCVVQGAAVYRILVGGGRAEGKTGLVSEDHKLRFMVKLPGTDYLGETFVFDGQEVHPNFLTAARPSRSGTLTEIKLPTTRDLIHVTSNSNEPIAAEE